MSAKTEGGGESLGHRVLEGLHLNLLGQASVFAINLAATPFIVHRLGPDGYALYTLMWTLAGYLALLNFGTGLALQKFSAENKSRWKSSPMPYLLRTALIFQLTLCAAGAVALLAGRGWVTHHLLQAQGPALAAAPRVFACVAVAMPAYFVLQFAICVLYGLQRFAVVNLLQGLQSVCVGVLAVAALKLGGGLRDIAVIFAVAHFLMAAGGLWLIFRLFQKPVEDRAALSQFARFSVKSAASQILWTLTFQGDRFFIGTLLPLTQLGYYAVSSGISQKFNALCGSAVAVAFPILTELHGLKQEARLRRFYLKATELALFFILPMSILSFILVPQFMTLWLGADFSRASTWPFRLLVLANLAYAGTNLPNCLATGKGEPQYFAYTQAGKVVLLLALWPALIPRLGILGAALGYMIAECIVSPIFMTYVHRRYLKMGWGEFWSEACWRPVVAGLGLAAAALASHAYVGSWPQFIGFGTLGFALFLGTGYWLLDSGAKDLLQSWVRGKLRITLAND